MPLKNCQSAEKERQMHLEQRGNRIMTYIIVNSMVLVQKLLEGIILKLPERTQSSVNNEATQSPETSVKYLLRTMASRRDGVTGAGFILPC